MRFLVDRCAGRKLADWLRGQGHDVFEARALGQDPGDRVLITIDTDFGELIYLREVPHAGLVRLPDVPAEDRIALVSEVIQHHRRALEDHAVVTLRGGRIRISHPPVSG